MGTLVGMTGTGAGSLKSRQRAEWFFEMAAEHVAAALGPVSDVLLDEEPFGEQEDALGPVVALEKLQATQDGGAGFAVPNTAQSGDNLFAMLGGYGSEMLHFGNQVIVTRRLVVTVFEFGEAFAANHEVGPLVQTRGAGQINEGAIRELLHIVAVGVADGGDPGLSLIQCANTSARAAARSVALSVHEIRE